MVWKRQFWIAVDVDIAGSFAAGGYVRRGVGEDGNLVSAWL